MATTMLSTNREPGLESSPQRALTEFMKLEAAPHAIPQEGAAMDSESRPIIRWRGPHGSLILQPPARAGRPPAGSSGT